ncbi:YjeF family domain-containing protein [Plasmodium yoelii 17X]|uniref:ATP-dependent (S)-NAD(P)H-hydrate dehydratase n=1 Tax=Plasmodium yoelii 17X TaxID=1323249 RepID=V7PDG0_PLAYE|nr:YjeF family domain-containing protein [Plasmodium yoelii 17X]
MEEFPFSSSLDLSNLNKMLSYEQLYEVKKHILPELLENGYKGYFGKICVIGGNEIYSGAPFLSALTTLRLGADLCFVVSSKECSTHLKNFSPELIVYPYLYTNKFPKEKNNYKDLENCVEYLSNRIDSCVIGPGLGNIDKETENCLKYIIDIFIKSNIFLILDADIIQFIITNTYLFNLVKNYKNCIFTPNKNEFKKMIYFLTEKKNIQFNNLYTNQIVLYGHEIIKLFNGPKILIKDVNDIFISKNLFFISSIQNQSFKRLAGLGDILTGLLAVFLAWGSKKKDALLPEIKDKFIISDLCEYHEYLDAISTFNASYLLKYICKETFKTFHIGMIATDVINNIPLYFQQIYCDQPKKTDESIER